MRIHWGVAVAAVLTGSLCSADGIAVFPVKLLDTSNEARDQTKEHQNRQRIFAETLGAELDGATLVAEIVADACAPETTECLLDIASKAGSDQSLLIVVQKTSTLIIQVFASLVDSKTGEQIDSLSLNFRGDNDESWQRGARFLAGKLSN